MRGRGRRNAIATGAALALLAGLGSTPASASTVSEDFGQLQIMGDNDADALTLSISGSTFTITDTGPGGVTTGDMDCTEVNPTTVTCPASEDEGFGGVFFVGLGDGADSFVNQNVDSFGSISAFGSTGPKTISGGPGPENISGGLSNDTLDGGPGQDSLYDGALGSDPANLTGGTDTLIGGEGDDFADYQRESEQPLNISLDGVANDGYAGEGDNVQTELVGGGNGPDTLTGDANANTLIGWGGGDLIQGAGGNDDLFGDEGLVSGMARRALRGGGPIDSPGADTLAGGAGRDGYVCGLGVDIALRDSDDAFDGDCERIGADVVGDSSGVSGKQKNKFKVGLKCPESEGAACAGRLKVTSGGKKVGKGKFSVGAGKTKNGTAKLSKKGRKALRRAGGSLLVTVRALTNEPGGTTESTGRILVTK